MFYVTVHYKLRTTDLTASAFSVMKVTMILPLALHIDNFVIQQGKALYELCIFHQLLEGTSVDQSGAIASRFPIFDPAN